MTKINNTGKTIKSITQNRLSVIASNAKQSSKYGNPEASDLQNSTDESTETPIGTGVSRTFFYGSRIARTVSRGNKKNSGSDQSKNWGKSLALIAPYAQIGFTMPACVCIGAFIGYMLDKRFGTSPLLVLLGFLFGVTAAFKLLYDLAVGLRKPQPKNASRHDRKRA